MIITIDGPTASGKSTIARLLAEQKNFIYLNSGLLFRAVAYVLLKNNVPVESFAHLDEEKALLLFADKGITYTYTQEAGPVIFWDHENITPFLKTADIDRGASLIATQPIIRQLILAYVRQLANDNNVIADGRDCGTVMFPHAEYKFFITASLDVRAERWLRDQRNHGKEFSVDEAKKIVEERDLRDSERAIAPLKPADDAIIIDTSHTTIQELLAELIALTPQ